MRPAPLRAVVVGTGLIGGSLAAAARRSGAFSEVTGVGRGRANLDAALAAGIVDRVSQDLEEAVAAADLIVLAAPVDTCVELLARVVAAAGEEVLITDVGSVKAPICASANELGCQRRFVGAHPMAGRTQSGSRWASADLFDDALVVITPSASDRSAVDTVEQLWRSVRARTLIMDAAVHDRVVALVSHLPQMVAFALSATVGADRDAELAAELAAGGLRDTAALATSNAEMWKAIAALNRDEIVAALDAFAGLWQRLREAVASSDGDELSAVMREANDFYRRASGCG